MRLKSLLLASILASAPLFLADADVNKASAAELDAIKGIGPSLSTRILEERKKAPFKDWADFVTRVPGVGPASAQKYSDAGLTVNTEAYKPSTATPAAAAKAKEPAPAKPAAKP